jgi:capsular polysaccharide transport system permease protein
LSLARGIFIQLQVVNALVLRETRTRFGAQQLGYLWAILEPLMWVGTFWAAYTIAHRRVPHGLEPVPFLVTGIVTFELVTKIASRVGEAVNGNKTLLFYPQVQPIDLVWARAALESATLSAVFIIIMGLVALFEQRIPVIDDLLATMFGIFLAAALGTSFGLLLCMLGVLSNAVERLRGPLMRPLFWTSGIFYTIDDVPEGAREWLALNPILHAVELVRDGWFVEYTSPTASPGYIVSFILLFMSVGLLLERIVRRRIELS